MTVDVKDLKRHNSLENYQEGYRIVYFYADKYMVGEYCPTIPGFMIGLADYDPVYDVSDIPSFISTNDLLNRCLEGVKDALGVAIYEVNGKCIDKIYR